MLKSSFWTTAKGTLQGVPKKRTSPTALTHNFGSDFVLLVHFLGHPVNADFQCLKVRTNVGAFEPKLKTIDQNCSASYHASYSLMSPPLAALSQVFSAKYGAVYQDLESHNVMLE